MITYTKGLNLKGVKGNFIMYSKILALSHRSSKAQLQAYLSTRKNTPVKKLPACEVTLSFSSFAYLRPGRILLVSNKSTK